MIRFRETSNLDTEVPLGPSATLRASVREAVAGPRHFRVSWVNQLSGSTVETVVADWWLWARTVDQD